MSVSNYPKKRMRGDFQKKSREQRREKKMLMISNNPEAFLLFSHFNAFFLCIEKIS